MSAMETMAKNILLSILPPEVMELLTKENVDAITERAKFYVATQAAILQEVKETRSLLEGIANHVGYDGHSRDARTLSLFSSGGDRSPD